MEILCSFTKGKLEGFPPLANGGYTGGSHESRHLRWAMLLAKSKISQLSQGSQENVISSTDGAMAGGEKDK